MIIEKLSASHDLAPFECEALEYASFLKEKALSYLDCGYGVTYVGVENGAVVGYVTVSMGSIKVPFLSLGHPLPSLHVGKLATHRNHTKKGVGKLLLAQAVNLALQLRDKVGLYAVDLLVDKNNSARLVPYYQAFGFKLLPGNPRHMVLKIAAS